MESLIKKMRVRFSGIGQEKKEETGSIRDRRIPPQKTQSFKGEKQKGWFRQQFSRKMSEDYGDYPTAVAAAAFAINSLEESNIPDKKKASGGPGTNLTASKKFSDEASMPKLEVPDEKVPISEATSGKMPAKSVGPGPSIKKTPTFADKILDITASTGPESAVPKKAIDHAPSFKKTPSLAEHLNSTGSTKPESAVPKPPDPSSTTPDSAVPKPDPPSTKPPAFQTTEIKRQSSRRSRIEETEADEWERAQMAKIQERYEKLSTTIADWENEKKTKAKRRMDRREMELQRRRARALQHFGSDIERINQIAGGARAQADENRRNKELKVKEKANKIRSTGKLPATCFCF